MGSRLNCSYFTDSVNSPFSQHFVVENQMCGEVSYDVFNNYVAGYAIQFSNVDQNYIDRIRPDFDMLIDKSV